jgi:hypothetical protein
MVAVYGACPGRLSTIRTPRDLQVGLQVGLVHRKHVQRRYLLDRSQ